MASVGNDQREDAAGASADDPGQEDQDPPPKRARTGACRTCTKKSSQRMMSPNKQLQAKQLHSLQQCELPSLERSQPAVSSHGSPPRLNTSPMQALRPQPQPALTRGPRPGPVNPRVSPGPVTTGDPSSGPLNTRAPVQAPLTLEGRPAGPYHSAPGQR
ncbi:unnamed protein product [Gadus morhua 'NCC']